MVFGTPRRLPRATQLPGRVVVLDIAFASDAGGQSKGFAHTTRRFIDALGSRLVCWVDHHDSAHHAYFAGDPRFVLATKAEHGACPEMVTTELVCQSGPIDTVVCHTDFDGVASAAKWLRGGREPYPGCDDDARAIDTRIGTPSEVGARIDRAIRARPRDEVLLFDALGLLVSGLTDDESSARIDAASAELLPREQEAVRLAAGYLHAGVGLVLIDVGEAVAPGPYDKTWLLLLGQAQAQIAILVDGDTATFAAPFDSGVDFLAMFGFTGGMPTLVSLHRAKLAPALEKLGATPALVRRYRTATS
ncbi:MAG: hypothetical protein EXR75_03755 [Myxococcales bacterium]|nr:hypothetical protein [Myxococcales bacterium]